MLGVLGDLGPLSEIGDLCCLTSPDSVVSARGREHNEECKEYGLVFHACYFLSCLSSAIASASPLPTPPRIFAEPR